MHTVMSVVLYGPPPDGLAGWENRRQRSAPVPEPIDILDSDTGEIPTFLSQDQRALVEAYNKEAELRLQIDHYRAMLDVAGLGLVRELGDCLLARGFQIENFVKGPPRWIPNTELYPITRENTEDYITFSLKHGSIRFHFGLCVPQTATRPRQFDNLNVTLPSGAVLQCSQMYNVRSWRMVNAKDHLEEIFSMTADPQKAREKVTSGSSPEYIRIDLPHHVLRTFTLVLEALQLPSNFMRSIDTN